MLLPFDIDAVVEEQDTALILSQSGNITEPDNKPAWFLASKLKPAPLNFNFNEFMAAYLSL